ncbi:MAG: hypothetical protein GEU90_22495, partial [Gemmatimonas sp.]|nr:hypothetical protein [Gemmatimonas sp.]
GISFVAAARVLESGRSLISQSDRAGERRWVAVGKDPESHRIVAVIYTMRGHRYRIISARRARSNEEEGFRERFGFGPEDESQWS